MPTTGTFGARFFLLRRAAPETHRRSTTRTIRLFLYSDSHTAPA